MFIIHELVACILVALIAAALLSAAWAILLLLKSRAGRVSWTLRKLTQGALSAIADNFPRPTLGKPLAPAQVPVVYRGEGRPQR